MPQAECRCQGANSAAITGGDITNDLNSPVVLVVTNSQVAVAGDFLVGLGHGSSDLVGVKVAAGLGVDKTDRLAVANESGRGFGVVVRVRTVGVEEPVVVGILVVVAGDLLLSRALRVGLDVGVQETTTISHVLDGRARSVGDFQGAVLADLGALQVCLEQGAHLRITRTCVVENGKVECEREHVDQERDDDEANDASDNVSAQCGDGHLGVAKLGPEILNGVQADEGGDEETDKLNTAHTANAEASHEQPEEPLGLESIIALVVKLGPAQNSRHSSEEQHRVEKDEAADGCVRVLAKDHESNKPDSRTSEVQLAGSVVGHGNAENTEEGVESSHEGVVDILGVFFSRLEFEGSVVASENTREANKHLAQGRVNIEVIFMLDVVRSELSKVGLVPGNDVADANPPESGEDGDGREDDGGDDGLPLIEEGALLRKETSVSTRIDVQKLVML